MTAMRGSRPRRRRCGGKSPNFGNEILNAEASNEIDVDVKDALRVKPANENLGVSLCFALAD